MPANRLAECLLAAHHAPADVQRFTSALIAKMLEMDENMGAGGGFVRCLEPMFRPISPATAPRTETLADIVRAGVSHDLVGVILFAARECGGAIQIDVEATLNLWHKPPHAVPPSHPHSQVLSRPLVPHSPITKTPTPSIPLPQRTKNP